MEQLKRLISDTADDGDDDLVLDDPPACTVPSANPLLPPSPSVNEMAAKFLKNVFKCSICLNTATLPAASCSSCYSVIGCIPCIEQWYESAGDYQTKCPLCRTNNQYSIVPVLREFALILQQPIPDSQESDTTRSNTQASFHSDTDSLETIPYGDNDVTTDGEVDDELPVMLD